MLLDPLSHKRTVVSGLNTVRHKSVTSSGEKAHYTFHGHAALQGVLGCVCTAGLHAQFVVVQILRYTVAQKLFDGFSIWANWPINAPATI